MRRRRTSSRSMQFRHIRCRLILPCVFLALTVFCFVLITNSFTRESFDEWMHSRHASHKAPERLQSTTKPDLGEDNDEINDEKLLTDTINLEKKYPDKFDVLDERTRSSMTKCTDGKIYISNEFYDCDGIIRDPNEDTDTNQKSSEEKHDKIQQKESNSLQGSTEKENVIAEDRPPKRFFLNCGSKMPAAIDLFLDTYPSADLFELYSFIPDKTYSILYKKYPNHTFVYAGASDDTRNQSEDIMTFGTGYETTQSVRYIDIASWILSNTKPSDNVVMLLKSDNEEQLIKHLMTTEAVKNIDKYYSSRRYNSSDDDLEEIQTLFEKQILAEIWDTEALTYSDYEIVNPKHIPTPGMTITNCTKADDDQKFLLLLYSPQASVTSLQVISFLQTFAHSDRLATWLFLPYEMFKFPPISLDFDALFPSFHVGLYYKGNDELASSLRNKATFVNRIFEKQETVLEYILISDETDSSVLSYVQEEGNYKVLKGGIDITHLSSKIKTRGIVDISETGKNEGDILLINIDKIESEYLTIFSLRYFIPWLLSVKDCVW